METNPKGTVFVELIAELMDLLKNPNVSRIEVVMANYELDDNGQRKSGRRQGGRCYSATHRERNG